MIPLAPYYCAENGVLRALRCMDTPGNTNVESLTVETRRKAVNDWIDPISNLETARVYIFQGQQDTVVVPGTFKSSILIIQLMFLLNNMII